MKWDLITNWRKLTWDLQTCIIRETNANILSNIYASPGEKCPRVKCESIMALWAPQINYLYIFIWYTHNEESSLYLRTGSKPVFSHPCVGNPFHWRQMINPRYYMWDFAQEKHNWNCWQTHKNRAVACLPHFLICLIS